MAIRRAELFAEEVFSTTNYRDSNQLNLKKIQNDHFISKIGEEAVKQTFQLFKKVVKGPDYRIYKGKNKSWDADLLVDGKELAVKTQKQSMANKYGCSWTFQASSKRFDPILNQQDAWVCFVLCDDTCPFYTCKIYPPFQIKELIFKNPKLTYLIGMKRVVYEADLPFVLY
jgi:hypothetical protein